MLEWTGCPAGSDTLPQVRLTESSDSIAQLELIWGAAISDPCTQVWTTGGPANNNPLTPLELGEEPAPELMGGAATSELGQAVLTRGRAVATNWLNPTPGRARLGAAGRTMAGWTHRITLDRTGRLTACRTCPFTVGRTDRTMAGRTCPFTIGWTDRTMVGRRGRTMDDRADRLEAASLAELPIGGGKTVV